MREELRADLHRLLAAAGCGPEVRVEDFRRYGSARRLYHFHIDNMGSY